MAHPNLSDLELLRRYEPVIRYTKGEEFFPTDVERYIAASSLWLHHPDTQDELLVEEGKLTLEALAAMRPAEFGAVHYLKFIEPLNLAGLAAFLVREGLRRLRDQKNVFRAGRGRLARVGYASRLLDALFSLTLLLRGRVPGDTAAAAALTYRAMQERAEQYVYYGRVIRESGWIVLQYWFFYAFNNWRSGFHGVNNHEADWEMINVYLYQQADGQVVPRWAAYASHDFSGADLRRRWDDRAELELVDGHPVVYAGAGSHASYFRRGEYLTEIEIPFLTPLIRFIDRLRDFWVRTLRQAPTVKPPSKGGATPPLPRVFRIPFVDYARGDGLSIGPGQDKPWTPVLLDPLPAWVMQYRGLWGLYARDPISGENAPSGPMYHRDGSVRGAWCDPLGWAGLDQVPTPAAESEVVERRRLALIARQGELDAAIAAKSREVQEMGVELAALKGNPHLEKRYSSVQENLQNTAAQLKKLRKERAETGATLETLARRSARLTAHEEDDPRAHIHRLAEPASDSHLRLSRAAELWAALSIGLLMIGFVFVVVTMPEHVVLGLLVLMVAFVLIEALFRRRLGQLIPGLTIVLAIFSILVLIFQFYWQIVVFGVLAAGLYLTWENIKELRG